MVVILAIVRANANDIASTSAVAQEDAIHGFLSELVVIYQILLKELFCVDRAKGTERSAFASP